MWVLIEVRDGVMCDNRVGVLVALDVKFGVRSGQVAA